MKKTNRCKTIIIAMLILLILAMTGCQKKPGDVVATLDGKEITLGFANFFARYTQADYDTMYVQYFGTDMWSQESGEEGATIEDKVKEEILDNIKELYILDNRKEEYKVSLTEEENAEIEKAADKFLEENTEDAIEEIGAAREYVIEMLRLVTIKDKMYDAITADVDTKVKDEDKNQKKIRYVKISTQTKKDENNEAVELKEDEVKTLKKDVKALTKEIQDGADFNTAFGDAGYTPMDAYYGADDETLADELKEATDALQEGETTNVVEVDDSLYIAQLVSALDEEATKSKEASIINERKSEKYNEVYEPWAEEVTYKVKDRVWKTVKFDRIFTVPATEDSESSDTEAAETGATETETSDSEVTDEGASDNQETNPEDSTEEAGDDAASETQE